MESKYNAIFCTTDSLYDMESIQIQTVQIPNFVCNFVCLCLTIALFRSSFATCVILFWLISTVPWKYTTVSILVFGF